MPFIIHGNADADRMAPLEQDLRLPLVDDVWRPLWLDKLISQDVIDKIPNPFYVIPPKKGEMIDISAPTGSLWVVNEKVAQIIDELEPEVHLFIPINLQFRRSTKEPGKNFILHIGQAIDAVVVDETDFTEGHGRSGFEKSKSTISPFGNCTLRGELIEGKHLWRGAFGKLGHYTPFAFVDFCSDALAERIRQKGIEGWRFKKCVVSPAT